MYCPNKECPDALDSGSPAEFRDEIVICPFCGSALVSSDPAWVPPPAESLRWVPALALADASWVPQAKAVLDEAGVQCFVKSEGAQDLTTWSAAAIGFNPAAGALIMVEEHDLDRADELLRDFKDLARTEPGTGPNAASFSSWTPAVCGKCGKALESSEGDEPLTHCYHCGWPLRFSGRTP